MIKNIYDKENKNYKHKYYCDCCYMEISEFGEICRNQKAMKFDLFDLCNRCEYLMKGEKDDQ